MKYISSVHDQNTARGRARNALTARPIATDREHAPPTLVTARGVGHAGAYHPHPPAHARRNSNLIKKKKEKEAPRIQSNCLPPDPKSIRYNSTRAHALIQPA